MIRNVYLTGCDILGSDCLGADDVYNDAPTVLAVQSFLVSKGFSVGKSGVDGKFGPDTAKALKAFQAKNNLAQSGVIDNATLMSMGVKIPGAGDAFFTEDEIIEVTRPSYGRAAGESPIPNGGTALAPAGTSFLMKPAIGPFKVYQVGIGAFALAVIGFGVFSMGSGNRRLLATARRSGYWAKEGA